MFNEKLIIKNLSKSFKKNKLANEDISISFNPGEITALIGHNGAGKSTLLKQILGILKPDTGEILYGNKNLITDISFNRKIISSMPQFQLPLDGITLEQNLFTLLGVKGVDNRRIPKLTYDILKLLDIDHYRKYSGNKLSGGLQRLLSFGIATAEQFPIILLDEPTNDVDPIRRNLIWKRIRQLADKGSIIIVVTHNLLEVEKYADSYVVLSNGRIVETGILRMIKLEHSFLSINTNSDLLDIPYEVQIIKNHTNELFLKFENKYLIQVMSWLFQMINDHKISSYKLSSNNLSEKYEDFNYVNE